ncbi:FecR domain-containing protein [Chitinophaga sp. MM2321]|uniref:FecR family protein n=1 Tax=Chitinophaga sp. MM2321 TaxID=3137178 RepID=UPI0032D5A85C
MKHDNNTVEFLLMSDDFRRWVLSPDRANHLFWEKWMAENDERPGLVAEARNIILAAEFDDVKIYEEKNVTAWERLNNKINEDPVEYDDLPAQQTTKKDKFFKRISGRKIIFRAAAILVGVLLSGAVYYFLQEKNTVKYVTNYGEIKTVTLPDGSVVTLNANSVLSFETNWSTKTNREVWIKGQAFFDVHKGANAASKVFIVHSDNLDVEVLGTTFDVNNRRNRTRVVLSTGKVKLKTLHSNADSLIMHPGELTEFADKKSGFATRVVKTDAYTSWRNNELIFNGNTIGEISRLLEDNYGYKVVIKNEGISERRFNGSFPANDPDILLTALSESFRVKVIKKGQQIVIENY